MKNCAYNEIFAKLKLTLPFLAEKDKTLLQLRSIV